MKKINLTFLVFLFFTTAYSQTEVNPFFKQEIVTPKAFLGLSTGLDNMVGLLGAQIDFVATEKLTLGGGLGISSWGYKYAVNLKFYPDGLYKYYFKVGYSQNSGLEEFETELELESGATEPVIMDLKPVGNLFFTAGWAWKMGKRNRFFLEGGYAFPLNTDDYYQLYDDNVRLSEMSEQVLRIMRPGGLVVCLGFNIAI
jgi:hypothetical protein